jgi:hypothetical protein
MAIIQRPTKQGGATTFQGKIAQGYTKILASEADADIDTIFAAWNGGADTVNIRDNAVTSAKIAAGAVTAREVADGSLGAAELADGSVTFAKLALDAQLWRDTGTTLTPGPNFVTRPVAVRPTSGGPALQWATAGRTILGRLIASPSSDITFLTQNMQLSSASVWSQDDAAKHSWNVHMRCDTDQYLVTHAPAGSTTLTTMLEVRGTDGKTYCTLADLSVTRPMLAANTAWQNTYVQALTAGFVSTTINTWLNVVTVSGVTTRGGAVLILVTPGFSVIPGPAPVAVVQAIYRDGTATTGTLVGQVASQAQASAGTITMPLPAFTVWDTPIAGAHTYTFAMFSNTTGTATLANTTAAQGFPGSVRVIELT